jgi:predicted kinase
MFELVSLFQNKCPEMVLAMKQADHHYSSEKLNPYHLESDIWTHTMQVCLMAERFNVNYMVKLACLFHDLGKPMAREVKEDTQRVRFFGHEGASVFLAMDAMERMSLDLSDKDKAHVLNLISHHTSLYTVFESKNPIKTVVDTYVGNKRLLEDLIWLSKCDALGRFTTHDTTTSENLETILAPALAKIKDKSERLSTKTCTILVGPPLSGKSTWLKTNLEAGAVVISRDDLVMEFGGDVSYSVNWAKVDQEAIDKELIRRKQEAIAAGKSIVLDLTHCSPKSRRQSFGQLTPSYKRKAVVFFSPLSLLIERNEKRSREENKSLKNEVVYRFVQGFTSPLLHEVDEIEYIFNQK